MKKLVATLFTLILCSSVFSEPIHPFISLNYGYDTLKADTSFHYTDDALQYNFADNSDSQLLKLFGGTIGIEIPFKIHNLELGWQVGLNLQQTKNLNITGMQSNTLYINKNTFDYAYSINSSSWMIDNKLFIVLFDKVQPYLLFGLGQATNTASNYHVTAASDRTSDPIIFDNATTTNIAYQIGTGVDIAELSNVRIGFGYRFVDLGKVTLGNGMVNLGQGKVNYGGPTLSQNHLYDNRFLIELTYII